MIGYHLSFTPGIHRFQFSKSGTGFGTNFYGSGLYVALDMEPIEEWAKEAGDAKCYVYDVEIPDTANIIDDEDKFWDVVARYVGVTPLRGTLSFCYFFFGCAKKK